MTRQTLPAILALSSLALALTACSDNDAKPDSSDDAITIVASTDVYGDVAAAIAGDRASVTSFINDPSQDPHEYEATVQDQLAVKDADVVIENGGGYDHFVDDLLAEAGSAAPVLNAVAISGLVPEDQARGDEEVEGFNEHVWYKFDVVDAVAKQLSEQLGALDPSSKEFFDDNYRTFSGQIDDLDASLATLKTTADGTGVAITEPVPLYLLDAAGMVNKTPAEFSEAVEEGDDVPPRVLKQTLDLFATGQVGVLAYNAQTADATTEQVQSAARAAGIPEVDFTETLPDGATYVSWQQANIDRLASALGS